jgi:hypothetical protein
MAWFRQARPSPAMLVAMTALVISLSGTTIAAVGGGSSAGRAITAKKKKQKHSDLALDRRLIRSEAHRLSVRFAQSAGKATSAATSVSATVATNAVNAATAGAAGSAGNSANLGGHPASDYLLSGTSGEPWHVVAEAGQPGFENGWKNVGEGFAHASFYLDPIGRVHMKGNVSGGTLESSVFTLPVGYRPPEKLVFVVATGTVSSAEVEVLSNGEVLASGPKVALDGISFRVG